MPAKAGEEQASLAENAVCKPDPLCSIGDLLRQNPSGRQADSPESQDTCPECRETQTGRLGEARTGENRAARAAGGWQNDLRGPAGRLPGRLASNYSIKAKTKLYYEERIKGVLKSWPSLLRADVRKLSEEECQQWAGSYSRKFSATSFNNSVGTLKAILAIGVEKGLRYSNPFAGVKRARVRPKELTLPSQTQFQALVSEIRRVPFGPGLASADLVEFLAYGGFRKGEAANVTWVDCDLEKGDIVVRGDPVSGTKNSEARRVPMIPDMRQLLARLKAERPDDRPESPVMRVRECQGALTRACKELGIRRITHHDLRHLFATRCIESGVDIPTVSRWLGHKDGGALAMKVYGHLRDQHSVAMAQKVTFASVEPENVLPFSRAAVSSPGN